MKSNNKQNFPKFLRQKNGIVNVAPPLINSNVALRYILSRQLSPISNRLSPIILKRLYNEKMRSVQSTAYLFKGMRKEWELSHLSTHSFQGVDAL